MRNWIKLIKKVKSIRTLDLSHLDTNQLAKNLRSKNTKTRTLHILGRWNTLTRKLLLRYSNLLTDKTQQIWHRLILKMHRRGFIMLRSLLDLSRGDMIRKLRQS